MSSKYEQIMCIPPLSKLEEITLVNLEGKGHVSKYYSILVAYSTESTLDKLNAWKIRCLFKSTKTDNKYKV